MNEFKIGDIIIAKTDCNSRKANTEYTVKECTRKDCTPKLVAGEKEKK